MLTYIHIHVEYEPPKQQQQQNNAINDPNAADGGFVHHVATSMCSFATGRLMR